MTTNKSWTEASRMAALHAYDVLDTEAEAEFDDLAALAARICDAPTALVSLVAEDRQWFKARVGLETPETGRDVSFCAHAMSRGGVMVVADTRLDPLFRDNDLVTGPPHVRFYAGAPLVTGDGLPLGTLCVLDTEPRPHGLTAFQIHALEVLARQVMNLLELRRALKARDESEQTTRRALAASEYVGAWDWDVATDRVVADERFSEMYGVDPAIGKAGAPLKTFTRAVHPDDYRRARAEIEATLESGNLYVSEYRLAVPGRPLRWVLVRGQVYRDHDGTPNRFPGVVVDITDRKAREAELAEAVTALAQSEARFRAIADSMPQMVWSTRPDGFHDYYNARWYEYTGMEPGSTDGEAWNGMFHPGDQDRAWALWRQSLESGEPYEIEYRLRRHDGVYRWTLGRAMPIRDEAGGIVRWFGTCTDIDDLKRMDQAKELLSQELSHRIKNIFAVVSALVALSARQFPEARAFAASLRTRINALARAHEFVRPHTETSRPTVGSMTLHAFLNSLFQAYADGTGAARIRISGDDATFDDQAATSVALLFHELATNASKYGALSLEGGHVDLLTRDAGDRFILTWIEHGGPPVSGAPERTGFGSSLATLSVEGQLGGRLQRDWATEGLRLTVDLPSTALSRRRAAQNVAAAS
ncbi:PAS domain-containing protein [uncultured Brevundimonas sp.]|uniref:PAS domain-containing protein n=1 Tax=uncultured Brevundimonas sp. TaxID=213418 RepID=UPI0030EB49FC